MSCKKKPYTIYTIYQPLYHTLIQSLGGQETLKNTKIYISNYIHITGTTKVAKLLHNLVAALLKPTTFLTKVKEKQLTFSRFINHFLVK